MRRFMPIIIGAWAAWTAPADGESTVVEGVEDSAVLEMAYSSEFFVDVGLGDAQAATAVWSKSLMQKWDLPFGAETLVFDEPEEVVEAVNDELIDLVVLTPLQYLRIREQTAVEPVLVASIQGQVTHPLVLLVRRDAGRTLADLAGTSLAIARAGKGRIGKVWLERVLRAAELPASDAFFAQVREVPKTAQAVLPVFLGEVDACLVPQEQFATMVELNPQLDRKLAVLATSPAFCQTLVCLRPGVVAQSRRLILSKLTSMHGEPLGRQILTLFRIGQLVPFDPAYTETTFDLAREGR